AKDFSLRDFNAEDPPFINASARYPSHLISYSQLASSKGSFTSVASIGVIDFGKGVFPAFFKMLSISSAGLGWPVPSGSICFWTVSLTAFLFLGTVADLAPDFREPAALAGVF